MDNNVGMRQKRLLSALQENLIRLDLLDDRETRVVTAVLSRFDGRHDIKEEDLQLIKQKFKEKNTQLLLPKKGVLNAINKFFSSVGGFFKVVFFIRRPEWYMKSCILSAAEKKRNLENMVKKARRFLRDHLSDESAQKFLNEKKNFWQKVLRSLNEDKESNLTLEGNLKNNLMEELVQGFKKSDNKRKYCEEKISDCDRLIEKSKKGFENFENQVKNLNKELNLHGMSELKIDLKK